MSGITRRDMLSLSGLIAGASVLGSTSLGAAAPDSTRENESSRKKILVVGAHPDDPETGCGGTMALLADAGHEVVAAYLTRGEAGIGGTAHDAAARIRSAEAEQACAILHARPVFLGQIDGACEVTPARTVAMQDFLRTESPDIILTHWPVDTHDDHRACSALVYGAWIDLRKPCPFYFFEVMTGVQTQNFAPTTLVDISTVAERKHAACFVHRSQHVEREYPESHDRMERFRGLEAGCPRAEAFVRHSQAKSELPV